MSNPRVNAMFELISSFSGSYKDKKKGQERFSAFLSRSVPGVGVEPTRPSLATGF